MSGKTILEWTVESAVGMVVLATVSTAAFSVIGLVLLVFDVNFGETDIAAVNVVLTGLLVVIIGGIGLSAMMLGQMVGEEIKRARGT